MLQLVYVEQVVPVDFAELGAGGFSTALLAPVDDRSEFELLALVQRLFLFIELNLLSVDGTCLQRFQGGYINFRLSLLSQLDHLMLRETSQRMDCLVAALTQKDLAGRFALELRFLDFTSLTWYALAAALSGIIFLLGLLFFHCG